MIFASAAVTGRSTKLIRSFKQTGWRTKMPTTWWFDEDDEDCDESERDAEDREFATAYARAETASR